MKFPRITIPAAIFLLFALLYIGLSLYHDNSVMFSPVWDIGQYRNIAEEGYNARPCGPHDYPPGRICGNVGWFPAWPLAANLLSFGNPEFGVRYLPFLFTLLGFILIYNLIRFLHNDRAAVIAGAALAASPCGFYLLTGFPYAFMMCLYAGYLFYLYRPELPGRRIAMPLLAVVFSTAYPSAFLMAIIPAVWLLLQYRRKQRRTDAASITGDLAFYILPFAAGPLLLSLYFYARFDDFFLITHFQEKYNRQWTFPLIEMYRSLTHFSWTSDYSIKDALHNYYAANFVLIWYGLIFLIFPPFRVKTELVIFTLLIYLFSPATGSVMSIWRHYILLFPAMMLIAASPRPFWLKISYIALGLAIALFIYFPLFINMRLI